jgi:nitronate monooxygenase
MATAFTRLLGIDVPIVQAPIGGMAQPRLAAAVSNAGALGMLALTWLDPDQVAPTIRETQGLTKKPFGVNLVLQWPQEHRLREALDAGARFVSFFWGDPSPHLAAIHEVGGIAALTVGSANEARAAAAAGVDVIVAQGWEAGGHVWGEVATMPLVPAVVDAVNPVPVVAAGGLADGRGLAAILALGASAGWYGTRFVMCEEAASLRRYRELLVTADETATFHSTLFDIGWPNAPHRVLRTGMIDAWIDAGQPAPGARPGEGDVVGHWPDGTAIARYGAASPQEGVVGDVDALSLWAGQSVGSIRDVLPAAEIVRRIMGEARSAMGSGASALDP